MFPAINAWMGGNEFRSLCQVRYLVRLTARRGESLLKACEKIGVGEIAQRYASLCSLLNR